MIGKRIYLQPRDMILNSIHDLAGLQKAETLICDSPNGIIRLRIEVYTVEREYGFTVLQDNWGRSEVSIEMTGTEEEKQRLIDHEFALLDYVLIDRTKIDIAEQEAWDRMIDEEDKAKESKGSTDSG